MATDQPDDEQDEETLAEAFWAVSRNLRHRGRESIGSLGITPAQARAVGELRRHGSMRISALSEHLHIAPRSGTEVVDALEERGLLHRSPDPDDRRATLVTLSTQGEKVAEAVRKARAAEAEQFFDRLSPHDRSELARIIGVLRHP